MPQNNIDRLFYFLEGQYRNLSYNTHLTIGAFNSYKAPSSKKKKNSYKAVSQKKEKKKEAN